MAWSERFVGLLARTALIGGVALIAFDAALIVGDVLGRALFGRPILGTVEIARNTVPLIVFCQAPATILAGRMLRVSALYSRLPVEGRRFIELLAGVMGIALFIVLVANMWHPMLHAWSIHEEEGMAGIRVPLAPIRTALVILWSISILAIVVVMARVARGKGSLDAKETH